MVVGASAEADEPPLLPASAFRVQDVCALDPFTAEGAQGLERVMRQRCRTADGPASAEAQGEVQRWGQFAEGRIGHTLSWGARALSARLRLGLGVNLRSTSMDTHAELAGGLWWRPIRRWALNVRFGDRRHDDGAVDRRLSVTSVWRPTNEHVLFTRWRSEDDEPLREYGLRWWMVPERVSFDLVWQATAEQDASGQLQLKWRGLDL